MEIKKKTGNKTPHPAKCRKCRGPLSGQNVIKWGGKRYHESDECAPEFWVKLVRDYVKEDAESV